MIACAPKVGVSTTPIPNEILQVLATKGGRLTSTFE